MSDCWDLANSWFVLDELGYVNPTLKSWWPNTIINLIHNIDPANTHFRWLGDTQSDPYFDVFSGDIWSYTTNCIFNAERYGYTKEAAWGRYFLDNLSHPSWGIPEGDTMLWFTRSYDSSAARIDYRSDPTFPRYIMGGIGKDQRMGFGYFRSDFSATATWGGFAGVGNYFVDHMNNIHGSFFLWRNGEYLTTDPHQYGGEEAGPIWNNLAIPNSVKYDEGGPIRYYNQGPAFMERGRVVTGSPLYQDVFYAMLNADQSYNLPYNQWAACQVCRTPVNTYRRHFVYDGGDFALVVDWVDLAQPSWTAWRIRTNGHGITPTKFGANELNLPSDKGGYRTLVRFLYPDPSQIQNWAITDEVTAYAAVDDWQIDDSQRGFACTAKTASSTLTKHIWITALHLGSNTAGTTQLDSATLISDASNNPIGALFGSMIFISMDGFFTLPLSFSTPSGTPSSGVRVLVADLPVGCYSVNSDGTDLGLYSAVAEDNTILFKLATGGKQTITINTASGACPVTNPSTPPTQSTPPVTAQPSSPPSSTGSSTGRSPKPSKDRSSSSSSSGPSGSGNGGGSGSGGSNGGGKNTGNKDGGKGSSQKSHNGGGGKNGDHHSGGKKSSHHHKGDASTLSNSFFWTSFALLVSILIVANY